MDRTTDFLRYTECRVSSQSSVASAQCPRILSPICKAFKSVVIEEGIVTESEAITLQMAECADEIW